MLFPCKRACKFRLSVPGLMWTTGEMRLTGSLRAHARGSESRGLTLQKRERFRVERVAGTRRASLATPQKGVHSSTRSCLPQLLLESRELILKLPLFLITQGLLLLAVLELLLDIFYRLLDVLGSERLLLLDVNLVPRTVEDLIRLPLVIDLGVGVLPTLCSQVPCVHDPLFRGYAVAELQVVGDPHHAAVPLLDRLPM